MLRGSSWAMGCGLRRKWLESHPPEQRPLPRGSPCTSEIKTSLTLDPPLSPSCPGSTHRAQPSQDGACAHVCESGPWALGGWRWGAGRHPPSSSQLKSVTNPGSRVGPSRLCVPHIIVRSPRDTDLESGPSRQGGRLPSHSVSRWSGLCALCQAHLHSLGWVGWVS